MHLDTGPSAAAKRRKEARAAKRMPEGPNIQTIDNVNLDERWERLYIASTLEYCRPA